MTEYQQINFLKFSDNMKLFLLLSVINGFGFLMTFVQLLIAKPTSKKVLVPIVFFMTSAFLILIAVDFYLEIQMTHLPPKETYTMDNPSKKGKARFKTGYLVIYGSDKTLRSS